MRCLSVVLLMVLLAACNTSSAPQRPTNLTGLIDAASYEIDVPASWNGTLFLYSHGYVAPGGLNSAQSAPSPALAWLLGHHFAAAGSAYASTGWAVEDAFTDQLALLDFFTRKVGKPKRVIAWGHSMGGLITGGLVQLHPELFAAAMPLCGVLAGGIATWNTGLDGAFAFKTLLAPRSQLEIVHITNARSDFDLAQQIFATAQGTPQGQARLALIAAVGDLPGWFDPREPEPAPTDYSSQASAQRSWMSGTDFGFDFQGRLELEQRAGGNPSWNVGVDYSVQLATSPDRDEVVAMYQQAGLELNADLATLAAGARIKPDVAAGAYLARNISFNGDLPIPVLSMHTTGDGLVIPSGEQSYASVVAGAGKQDMLRQVFVHRAGHCTFTAGETIAALQQLLRRLDTGRWDDAGLQPNGLKAAALAQGASLNSFLGFSLPPSFVDFAPAPFPRPFPSGGTIPA